MKNYLLAAICCMGILCLNAQSYDLAIRNVKIFNPETKSTERDKTILINKDRIAKIIDASDSFQATSTIQGEGRLLSPGFIDTHVHNNQMFAIGNGISKASLTSEDLLLMQKMLGRQHLPYGTTSIIDMGHPESWIDQTVSWQENPVPFAPNAYFCGSSTISDENRTPAQHHNEVKNPEEARAKVRRYQEKGLRYMKLYSRLRKPEMEAIIDEAKGTNIILNAHIEQHVRIPEAIDMGLRNFEHFFTLIPAILEYDNHWDKVEERYNYRVRGIDDFAAHLVLFWAYIDSSDELKKRMDELMDKMAREGATISTTLHVLASSAYRSSFFTSFEHFPIREEPFLTNQTNEYKSELKKAFDVMMSYVKKAYDKGVKIRIGTDCRFGGRALMSEFALLAEAGFTTAEILEIATLNGYEAMALDNDRGQIKEGMKADFVLFEKDPFLDPSNLQSPKTVFKDGQLVQIKRSLAYEILDSITMKGLDVGLNFFERHKKSSEYELYYNEFKKIGYDLLSSGLVVEARKIFEIASVELTAEALDIDENLLNNAGYALLQRGDSKKALECFKLNTELFPKSWNVWDSLGEAYMSQGLKYLAIKYYENSIKLNPENAYGKAALEQLRN